MRIDWPVWRYIGNLILATLICFVTGFALGFVAVIVGAALYALFGETVSTVFLGVAAVAFVLTIIPFSIRLFIKLPAVALEREHYGFGRAWQDSKGNTLKLLGFMLLITLLLSVVGILTGLAMYILQLAGIAGEVAASLLQSVVNWGATIMGVTMLTTLYGIFYEGRTV